MIALGASADPITLLIVTGTSASSAFSQGEDERPVREMLANSEGVNCPDGLDSELAGTPLIGKRAVDESIGEDPFACFNRRTDDLVDVIRTRRRKQQRFGTRTPAFLVAEQQQFADLLGAFASTGFSRNENLDVSLPQGLGQRGQLGRLADPFPAFERDEARFGDHAIPKSCLRPIHARVKKPASPTASPATSGITCSPSGIETTKSAMCWPLAIGALTGPW